MKLATQSIATAHKKNPLLWGFFSIILKLLKLLLIYVTIDML